MQIKGFLENLEFIFLGISYKNRMALKKAKKDNNISLYKDILFRALLHDDKRGWWHTGIW